MRLTLLCWAGLCIGVLLGSCKPEDEPLECGNGREARDYCCTDPSGEQEPSCEMRCFSTCESDDTCADPETCEDGVCAETWEDCSL